MDVFWSPPKAKPDPNIRTAYMTGASVEDDTGQVLCRRFELLAPIGFGATAAVYRALDRETKSEVAVKILYKSLRDDAEALRYFAQEGRLAARIVHPHLLRAHYFGQRRGAPFIVFELVPGTSPHGGPWAATDTLKTVVVMLVHPDGTREPLAMGIPGDREVDEKRLGAQVDPAGDPLEVLPEAPSVRLPGVAWWRCSTCSTCASCLAAMATNKFSSSFWNKSPL